MNILEQSSMSNVSKPVRSIEVRLTQFMNISAILPLASTEPVKLTERI